jgi:hypothetical protein
MRFVGSFGACRVRFVKWSAWYRFTHAASCAQKEQFMTTTTTTNSTSWKNWSKTTKLSVGLGAIVAACVVVFLYTT